MLDQFDLSGQLAVVTGGTRGIGRAISEGFAAAGADVVPTSRSQDAVDETVASVREHNVRSIVCPTDVTDEQEVTDLFERTKSELGSPDIVVNNAGVNPEAALGQPSDVSLDAFKATTAVNLNGAFLCARAAADALSETGGAVVNIASVGGIVGLPRQHPYVASKHGLVGLTRSLAIDWAPTVRVNAIAPGYISTDLIEDLEANDRLRESIINRTPLERIGSPTEIAGPAIFLASDAASYLTGAVLAVDGGWTAR